MDYLSKFQFNAVFLGLKDIVSKKDGKPYVILTFFEPSCDTIKCFAAPDVSFAGFARSLNMGDKVTLVMGVSYYKGAFQVRLVDVTMPTV